MDTVDICELHGEESSHQREDAECTAIRKRIVICCDGTWQSSVSGKVNVPSNVTRLCRALNHVGTDKDGKRWQQVVWYDSGVGTTSLPLADVIQGAVGEGVEGSVIEAYNFCVLNYNPGDKIMCFGFSRGAYTARTIAGLISDIGICHKRDLNKFPDLWAVYRKVKHGKRFHRSDLWFDWIWGKADEHQGAGDANNRSFLYSQPPRGEWAQEGSREVEVVGVYDTVGAIGMPEVLGIKLPSPAGWENVGLSYNIKYAFQALALDEYRKAFSPTLWYLDKKKATEEDVKARKEEEELAEKKYSKVLQDAKDLKAGGRATDNEVNAAAREVNKAARAWNKASRRRVKSHNRLKLHPLLKQVWFPGYHINIGGGSMDTLDNKGDMEELASITFAWMLDQIREHLSLDERYIVEEKNDREEHLEELNKLVGKGEITFTSRARSERDCFWRLVKATALAVKHPLASIEEPSYQNPHKYGWGTGDMKDSYTAMYWLNGRRKRTPGEYAKKDGEDGEDLRDTCEFVHPVVNFRVETFKLLNEEDNRHPTYRPIGANMKYERRKVIDNNGIPSFVYDIGKSHSLPEWRLEGRDSYERLVIAGHAAHSYVNKLDEELKTRSQVVRCSAGPHQETPMEHSQIEETAL